MPASSLRSKKDAKATEEKIKSPSPATNSVCLGEMYWRNMRINLGWLGSLGSLGSLG
jgi:hypothetical protein